jgi:O-acetylserine/cysteine efflux transporter
MAAVLPLRYIVLAVAIMAVWGSNFVVARYALDHVSPLLFATLRFALVLLPAALFVPRPACGWKNLALYGLFIGVGQFGLLYIALNGHISPGLASLVVQTQVFFTIGLAMMISGERVQRYQWIALLLAAAGLAVIMAHTDGSTTALGLGLILLAALCWAGGNITATKAGRVNILGYVVWSSAFAVPPLLALTFVFEGADVILAGLRNADAGTWLAVVWQSVGNTIFGYGAWGWLLARYPAATIAPMAMLVPVFGMGSSWLLLGESMPAWKLEGAGLVMAGLALNMLWPRWQAYRKLRGVTNV